MVDVDYHVLDVGFLNSDAQESLLRATSFLKSTGEPIFLHVMGTDFGIMSHTANPFPIIKRNNRLSVIIRPFQR